MLKIKYLGIALCLFLFPFLSEAEEKGGPKIGQYSPNIVGRTLDNKWYRLEKDQGRAKVINFFWINCVPCRQEMSELSMLEKQYPKVKFISVHTEKETQENISKFINSLEGAPSNIVLTSGGIQGTFQYLGLPHTILLDKDNIVLMNLVGYTPANMNQLSAALQKIE